MRIRYSAEDSERASTFSIGTRQMNITMKLTTAITQSPMRVDFDLITLGHLPYMMPRSPMRLARLFAAIRKMTPTTLWNRPTAVDRLNWLFCRPRW